MTPWLRDPDVTLYHGDVLDVLQGLPDGCVDCVVTSPPYWGLRDYGEAGQVGLESTPDEYVAGMVGVFREVRRVLAPHGTVWCNLGDSYASGDRDGHGTRIGAKQGTNRASAAGLDSVRPPQPPTLKPKDLVGVPWRVAFALQADDWWLRSDIIWAKPNPMPESVTDRPTKAHEYVFLLSKQPRYYFDAEAVREKADWARWGDQTTPKHAGTDNGAWVKPKTKAELEAKAAQGRNVRSVWTIATQPYPEAHFATYPEELVRRCVLAGCPERVCRTCGKASERLLEKEATGRVRQRSTGGLGTEIRRETHGLAAVDGQFQEGVRYTTVGWSDCGHNNWRPGTVLDPFVGSGTTCKVARDHGRHSIGIDLNEQYLELAARRLQQQSLLV